MRISDWSSDVCSSDLSVMPEVHQKKPQIVQHIDRRKIGAELQTIERNRLAVDHRDVGEVQIAMPVTDAPHPPPLFQQRRQTSAPDAQPRVRMGVGWV